MSELNNAYELIKELRSQGALRITIKTLEVEIHADWSTPPFSLPTETTPQYELTTPAPVLAAKFDEAEIIERGHVLVRQERLDELEEKARRYDALDSPNF